jgi:hypothetical protein
MEDPQEITFHKTKLSENGFGKNHLRMLPNRAGNQKITDSRGTPGWHVLRVAQVASSRRGPKVSTPQNRYHGRIEK